MLGYGDLRLLQHRGRLFALLICVSVLFGFLLFLFFVELEVSLVLLAALPTVDAQRRDSNAVALVGNLASRRMRTVVVARADQAESFLNSFQELLSGILLLLFLPFHLLELAELLSEVFRHVERFGTNTLGVFLKVELGAGHGLLVAIQWRLLDSHRVAVRLLVVLLFDFEELFVFKPV